MISDIRDSGNIEQDADVVILLYCEQYYKQSKELVEGMTKSSPIEYLELNVAKNRNGATGVAYAAYNRANGEVVGKHYDKRCIQSNR
ncbi:DNA helicase OS=Ureibacillus acetophenoni OX=614649 GN=SAMN05877842_11054 PE=3 SV=1 [Ureibacillus acetophenoni]